MANRSAEFRWFISCVVLILFAVSGCAEQAEPRPAVEAESDNTQQVASRIDSGDVRHSNAETNEAILTDFLITPESRGFYELAAQVQRRRIFLHIVRSGFDCGGWFPDVPQDLVHVEQSFRELLQQIADQQNIQFAQIQNAAGVHFLFYDPAADDVLLRTRFELSSEDAAIRLHRLRAIEVQFDPRIVESLAACLKRPSEETLARNLLRYTVGITPAALMLPEPEALSFLEYEIEHGNRIEAIGAVGHIGGSAALRMLQSVMETGTAAERQAAVQSLRFNTEPDAPRVLLELVDDQDVEVRKTVAEACSWFVSETVRNGLERLISDSDQSVRVSAALALGWHGPAALELLRKASQDEGPEVRRATMQALGRVASREAISQLGLALRDSDYLVRESAASALGGIGGPDVMLMLEKATRDASFDTRWAATGALGLMPTEESLKLLRERINDTEIDVQKRAVYHLGIFDQKVALPLLKTATDQHTCCHIQGAAAAALAEIGGDESVELLAALLERNTRADYWHVRRRIAYSLGTIGTDKAVRQLERILESEQPAADTAEREASLILAVRRGAIDALGTSQNPLAVRLLVHELNHSDRSVRHDAINSLARVGGVEARDRLIQHAGSSEEDREAVNDALRSWQLRDSAVRKYLGLVAEPTVLEPE